MFTDNKYVKRTMNNLNYLGQRKFSGDEVLMILLTFGIILEVNNVSSTLKLSFNDIWKQNEISKISLVNVKTHYLK